MHDEIHIDIIGIPKPQPRPRAFVRRGTNRAGVYDPGTASEWKARVEHAVVAYTPTFASWIALGSGVVVDMEFRFPRPRSHCKPDGTLRRAAPAYHLTRPDVDNLAKAVLDAMLQCGAFPDDSVVVRLAVSKRYATADETPGCLLNIKPT